ncbi:MAG: class I SAM-dependent methyltransferase, partial [Calditrichia bacterium]
MGSYLDSDKILRCEECGMIFLSEKMIIQNSDDYYSNNRIYGTNLLNPLKLEIMSENARSVLKLILKYINPATKKLLDVGAKAGVFVGEANKIGFDATGIELNKNLVEEARKKGTSLFWGSIEKHTFDYRFDIITLFHVLEHLENPIETIKKLKENLVESGFLIIEVPNINSYLAQKDKLSW